MALRIIPKLINNSVRRRYLHLSSRHCKLIQFILSDIGEGIREVTVKDWFVKVGDKISQFDDICLVESDKASVNITSRYDGTVKRLYHGIGDTAFVGKALVDIDIPDDESASEKESDSEDAKDHVSEDRMKLVTEDKKVDERFKTLATPAVRRLAMAHNILLQDIKGTGKGGRVMKEDILKHIDQEESLAKLESSQKPQPPPQVEKQPRVTPSDRVVVISGIKKAMVKSMTLSNTIPSFGYSDDINVTKLVAAREEIKEMTKKLGLNITYMPFFLKALSKGLDKFPELNATVDEKCEKITVRGSHNIGVAIDTPDGLIVPNIKNVQDLSIVEISQQLNNLIVKAKERKLSFDDLSGGTFTISNIGIIGGTYVRPLINPPEVAILGIGKFQNTPIYVDDNLVKANMCQVSWAADHRVIDGATMARFANVWRDYVENPLYLMLNA
ncbi:lipoamide acyltransferase component of branched-chain alpha-keto acid dehydrogenase complex, mitochondrial [Cimex lectularius]|uniref:Dihydrolipoamide acetyltransferase component of pyruvate dehydrogenase complex n=1 Tax=Cimex lectularius TaxID=79782 RepID=A0A8I6RUE4_CIMLE|nr:lipoamide acyltransferase component of branched-chain alpha-keto acid dehydrogenase complex, mitochondrial [Cimex lectularius]